MAGYRVYFMDRFSGHIDHCREFVADDDSAAIAIADGWNDGQPMELWLGGHKLRRWEAEQIEPEQPWFGVSEMMGAEGQEQDHGDRNADQPQQDGTHNHISYAPAPVQE